MVKEILVPFYTGRSIRYIEEGTVKLRGSDMDLEEDDAVRNAWRTVA